MSVKPSSELEQHSHHHSQNRFAVIPTPERLKADSRLAGRGVTIALIDSGFYPHPDLTLPVNRIRAYKDVTRGGSSLNQDRIPPGYSWHGTQTSVAAAGNGYLSGGIYRGLASEADVVLVRVSNEGKITEDNIALGIEWVLENKNAYNIRVVSISLGGDQDVPHKENAVDRIAEQAVRAGLTLVVAAGNSGCTDRHQPLPPANAPSVITVGGYDDGNQLDNSSPGLYCSSFGPTADGNLKPEIVAPAMWVAAPILPHTASYRRAEALSMLLSEPDYKIGVLVEELWEVAGLPGSLSRQKPASIRATIESLLNQEKVIATHYQHVDGTSFAAPIVASLVAQMLEANPMLTPAMIKHILISSADRIAGAPLIQQGYGMVNARRAVELAAKEQHPLEQNSFGAPRIDGQSVQFFYHDHSARTVCVAGAFNSWESNRDHLTQDENGIWKGSIACPGPGRYPYKFVVNGDNWTDDPSNGMKEADSYGGFNSVLHIS